MVGTARRAPLPTLCVRPKLLLARREQMLRQELPQWRGVLEFERDQKRHDLAQEGRESCSLTQSRQILFRGHQRQRIAFGLRDQCFALAFRKRMMVGEGTLADHFYAACA